MKKLGILIFVVMMSYASVFASTLTDVDTIVVNGCEFWKATEKDVREAFTAEWGSFVGPENEELTMVSEENVEVPNVRWTLDGKGNVAGYENVGIFTTFLSPMTDGEVSDKGEEAVLSRVSYMFPLGELSEHEVVNDLLSKLREQYGSKFDCKQNPQICDYIWHAKDGGEVHLISRNDDSEADVQIMYNAPNLGNTLQEYYEALTGTKKLDTDNGL